MSKEEYEEYSRLAQQLAREEEYYQKRRNQIDHLTEKIEDYENDCLMSSMRRSALLELLDDEEEDSY